MVYKQDFTNVLDIQIARFEKEIDLLKKEIKIREDRVFTHGDVLESIQNKRTICALEKELDSKKEFLFKLKDKKLFDTSALNEDYADCMNNYKELSETKIKGDEHDQARFSYIKTEMLLWAGKDESVPEKKEACVFYFKALKELISQQIG
jgi:hypothetical protein